MVQIQVTADEGEDLRKVMAIQENLRAMLTGNYNAVSDGYHTIAELYQHRIKLWILVATFALREGYLVYRFPHYEGWFVLGVVTPFGQVSYHVPNSQEKFCEFARLAPEMESQFDGHTCDDALERIQQLATLLLA